MYNLRPFVLPWLIALILTLDFSEGICQAALKNNLLFKSNNKILVAAHRGNWKNYPENSIPGVTSCIETGIDIVEIDVQKTKDGHYVLMHDQTIDRTTNGKGKVSNYTLHQIQRFYLKDKNDSLTEYRIPTLDTILKLTNGKIILNIDKSGGHFSELTQLIDSLNCADHIILKGTGDGKIFKALNNQDSTSIYYMPILSNNSKIDTFLVNYHPPLFEILLSNDSSKYSNIEYLDSLKSLGIHIWYNALFSSIAGGHSEKAQGIEAWNWFIKHKASIIQTDYPFHLIKYLNEQELHTSLAIQDTFDLSSLPVQDTTIASIKPAQKNNYRPLNNSPKKEKNFHIVKEKETLYRIAIDYGITVKHIHQLNPSLKKKNTIKAGQKIRVR